MSGPCDPRITQVIADAKYPSRKTAALHLRAVFGEQVEDSGSDPSVSRKVNISQGTKQNL